MTITASTTSVDREKFLAAKLIARAHLSLVAASICDKLDQSKGTGLTAYFVRYERMNVPLAALTEGTDPTSTDFTLTEVTVTLDQWGDFITLTDVAELTTKHPLLQKCIELLADNAQRVIDREVQIVWLAGTNVQYGDGSVTTRATITNAMNISDQVIQKARISLVDGGAPPRGGPSQPDHTVKNAASSKSINQGQHYVAICGPQVMGDIMATSTSLGTFASVAMYANQKALYNSEVGTWLNMRWVETNFIPKFTLFGTATAAVASAAANGGGMTGLVITAVDGGGTLTSATTYFWKVTRKLKTRGFEESISVAHSTASTATADNESFTVLMPSDTNYVYNLYFDSVQAGGTGTDATLKLYAANQAAATTVTVTAVATGAAAPANILSDGTVTTVHPVYIHGAESCNWVTLQKLTTHLSKPGATTNNPLELRRTVGYKFLSKSVIRDQLRMLRLEVTSSFN